MAKEYKIEISKRDGIGKKEVKKIRQEGNIPGVFYSKGSSESIPFQVNKKHFYEALKSGSNLFNISVGENKQVVIFKAAQYHPVTEQVLHIDFYGIRMDKPVNIKIAVKLTGDSIGVIEEGGVLNQATNEIEIQCLPADIPEFVETDIS